MALPPLAECAAADGADPERDPDMSRFSVILAVSILALGGCDRASEQSVQRVSEGETQSPEGSESLTGTPDRSGAGAALPDFTVTDPDGDMLDLAGLEGAPVLLNLWATWCAPCVVEMPMLDALAEEFDGELRVVTVSQDIRGAEVVEPFFDRREFTRLEPWLDPDSELAVRMSEGGQLPLSVVYNAQGREVLRVAGGYEWDSAEAKAMLREVLDD